QVDANRCVILAESDAGTKREYYAGPPRVRRHEKGVHGSTTRAPHKLSSGRLPGLRGSILPLRAARLQEPPPPQQPELLPRRAPVHRQPGPAHLRQEPAHLRSEERRVGNGWSAPVLCDHVAKTDECR